MSAPDWIRKLHAPEDRSCMICGDEIKKGDPMFLCDAMDLCLACGEEELEGEEVAFSEPRTFCGFLRECTGLTDPRVIRAYKVSGTWTDEHQALNDAIERNDDSTARRLILDLNLFGETVLAEADEWIAGEVA